MTRQLRIIVLVVVGLAVLAGAGCQGRARPQPTATPPAASTYGQPKSVGSDHITALGTVHPAQTLQLSFTTAGPVRTLAPSLGTEVEAGELLAELDTTALALALESARQEVTVRQAALDKLLDGPGEAPVARAERDHAQQVAQAQVALHMAQLQLEQTRSQDQAPAVEVARLGQQQAALQVDRAKAQPPTPELTSAQVDLARARDALARAQDEYRKALDRPWEPQEIRDGLARAVQQATWDVQSVEARLEAAQDAQRAHQLGVRSLGVQTDIAGAQAAQAVNAQRAYTATLALLAAQVEGAQLALEGLEAWTNPLLDAVGPQEIAQAEARLEQAELEVKRLAQQIDSATLRAPFDGVISAVYVHPGEWAMAGAAVVEILDTGRWLVETRNVSELAIGQVRVGQEASVQVIPFGDERLRGQVEAISPVAIVQQGDTTYTLVIALDPTELNLRPGMNAQVGIQIGN